MKIQTSKYGIDDASFIAAGKHGGIEKLVNRFYDHMEELPVARKIREMHANDLTESREKLTCFLCGWLGGPKLFSKKYGPIKIPMAHAHLVIEESERDVWLHCMQRAVDEQPYTQDFKGYLMEQLFVPAERIRSVGARLRAETEPK